MIAPDYSISVASDCRSSPDRDKGKNAHEFGNSPFTGEHGLARKVIELHELVANGPLRFAFFLSAAGGALTDNKPRYRRAGRSVDH
jgi:hypothetical protein